MSIRTTKFRFGPVRQEVGEKHVRQGDLIEAINVRQTEKEHVYAKRRGFIRAAQTFSGGSLSGTPASLLPGETGDNIMRDSGDQLWSRSSTSQRWTLSGTHPRPWPEAGAVATNLYTAPQPFSCVVGDNVWFFALTTNAYEFVIVEAATGVVISARQTNTATAIVHASAAYDGTYVWVFWVDNGANGTVRCHRITAATPTVAPVATNYYTFPAAPTDVSTVRLQQVQARYFSAASQVFVVAAGGSYVAGPTYKRACMHSVLDPATGLAVAVGTRPATCQIAYSGASGNHTIGGLYILDNQTGSGAYWWYTVCGVITTDFTRDQVALVRVDPGGFAAASLWPLAYVATATGSSRSCIGLVSDDGVKKWVLSTSWRDGVVGAFGATGDTYITELHLLNDTTASTAAAPRTFEVEWMASGFAKVGTHWYAIAGFDDVCWSAGIIASDASSLQRGYHVREFVAGATADASTFNVVAQFKIGSGPGIWHRASGLLTVPSASPIVNCTPPAHVSGTKIITAAAVRSGVTGYVDLAQVRVETAKTYGKDCQAMGRGFSPGSIPVVWNSQCPAHEIAPLSAPSFINVTGGVGSDFVIAAACYAFYDNDGVVWRSAPYVLNATIGAGATLYIPVQPLTLASAAPYKIEVYLGTTSTAKLQAVLTPPTGATSWLYVTHTVPAAAAMVNGEILYTTGNALANTWPVACQAIAHWRNRVLAAQGNDVWASKELTTGFGPLFNEVQVSRWSEETGEITAMGPTDWNYLGLLSTRGAAVVSGAGPDGVGNGNFIVQELSTRHGCAAGRPVVQGKHGLHYQSNVNGRIMCITPSLAVLEASGGAYDYSAYVFTGAAWYPLENMIVFLAPASKAMVVIDYQHPADVAPFGKTYLWTFTTLQPYAATVDTTGLAVVDGSAMIYRTSGSVWVDQKSGGSDSYQMQITTGQLQPGDLQGEFDVSMVQVLVRLMGNTGITITNYPDYVVRTVADARITSKSVDLTASFVGESTTVAHRPSSCARVKGYQVRLIEKAAVTTQSFEFEGLAVEFATTGKLQYPASGKVI